MGRIIMTVPAVSPSSSMVWTPHSVTYSVSMPSAPRSRSTTSIARSSSAYACFCSGERDGTVVLDRSGLRLHGRHDLGRVVQATQRHACQHEHLVDALRRRHLGLEGVAHLLRLVEPRLPSVHRLPGRLDVLVRRTRFYG